MALNRNHEGYHDPTACEAVRWVYKHPKTKAKEMCLTFQIGDTQAFRAIGENTHDQRATDCPDSGRGGCI